MTLSSRPLLDTVADGALFVGRQAERRTILAAVESGFNTALFGARGSGRTSLLRRVAHDLRLQRLHRVEFLDGSLTTAPYDLLCLIAERLVGPRTLHVTPRSGFEQWLGHAELRPSEAGRMDAELSRLRQAMQEQSDGAERDDEGRLFDPMRPSVVLLDGPAAAAAHTLFGQLRDEMWTVPIVWVVSAELEQRGTVLRPPADGFFDEVLTLADLPATDARELVRRRLGTTSLPAAVVEEVVARADGGPRRLLTGLRNAVMHQEAPAGQRVSQVAEQQARARLAQLGRPAAMLVAELQVRGGAASASDAGLLDALGWTRSRASQVFRQLEAAGLVDTSQDRLSKSGRPRKVFHLRGALR